MYVLLSVVLRVGKRVLSKWKVGRVLGSGDEIGVLKWSGSLEVTGIA